jgi:5-methylcytosine-specific restriction endonuclease McrA
MKMLTKRTGKPRLDEPVLVLNRSWLAVNVANVRRAVCLVALGHAHVVDPERFSTHDFADWLQLSVGGNGDCLHSLRNSFRIPEIIVLTRYNGRQTRGLKLSRRNVLERDEHTCQYCGKHLDSASLTLDHVVPRSRGGQTVWENVVAACMRCNDRKGDRTPEESDMGLVRQPRRPRWASSVTVRLAGRGKPSWQRFLEGTPGGGVIVA